jgi:DNA-binding response OmpR family regulator
MRKIIISDNLRAALAGEDALFRNEITIFTAPSLKEILRLHRVEKADLIIADMSTDGGDAKDFCAVIRKDDKLKKVSILLVYPGDIPGGNGTEDCGANAVMKQPVNSGELVRKAAELLDISRREGLREVVMVTVRVDPGTEYFFAVSNNISASGMLLETDRVLAEGAFISCSFVLQHQVTVSGQIVRVRKDPYGIYHYGVRFHDPDLQAKAYIEEFIRSRLQ